VKVKATNILGEEGGIEFLIIVAAVEVEVVLGPETAVGDAQLIVGVGAAQVVQEVLLLEL
jgi:hypothetical protein